MQICLADMLLDLARAYGAANGLTIGTVGRKIAGDSRFFTGVDAGAASFTAAKFDAVVRAFADDWPNGADWPASVPRVGTPVAVRPQPDAPHRFAESRP